MAKKNGKRKYMKRDHILQGFLCLGRKWDKKFAIHFHMRFDACDFANARAVAMNRLKAFARRRMEKGEEKNFVFQGVNLQCCVTGHKTALRPGAKNNGLLYKTSAFDVFY